MKHKIKMVVSDLDDTLLRSDKSVSEYTKRILSRCRDAGIKVVYATARSARADSIVPVELFDGRIVMNGAVVRINDTVVHCRLIPYQTARPLLMACDRHGLRISSEAGGMHYSNYKVSDVWPHITYFRIVDFSVHDIDTEKLCIPINNPDVVEFIEAQLPEELYLKLSNDGLAMVMHKEATKSKAAAELARLWGIAPDEIAAFGDDLNDIDLLSYAGIGVAMENAHSEVKAIADLVCPDNDNDGVAKWLEENVL